MKKVLVLGIFARHDVPAEEVVRPVLGKLGWDEAAVEVREHLVDGRTGVDFADPTYLEDAVRRVYAGLREVDLHQVALVVVNVSGFNPSALILVGLLVGRQEYIAQTGWAKFPLLWGVQFDKERGYLAYELGPHNGFLREQGLTWV